MASSSDLVQQAGAGLLRVTPVAIPGAGVAALDRAAAIQRLKAARVALRARETGAFSAGLASLQSFADQAFSRQPEQLEGLKDEALDLQVQLKEAVALQLRQESKCRLAKELISAATATNEQLRSLIEDYRDKRDKLAANASELSWVITNTSDSNGYAEMKVPKAVLWYDKFLGFRIIGGEEGLKFVFNYIDPQRPEKEYSFRVSLTMQFVECDPYVNDIEELGRDLDLSKHLFEFARMAREKFQSSYMNETVRLLPAKRGATALSGDVSPGVLRRSPRLEGVR